MFNQANHLDDTSKPIKSAFTYFLICNIFFLVLQLLIILYSQSSSFGTLDYHVRIYIGLLVALLVQIALCIVLSVIQTSLLWGVSPWCKEKNRLDHWLFAIAGLSLTAILTLNCLFFPLSVFSQPFVLAFPKIILIILCIASLIVLAALTLLTFWRWLQTRPKLFIISGMLVIPILMLPSHEGMYIDSGKTNLVIIGIDSTSPAQVSPELTPNIYKFLNNSVHFLDTTSPLARTTPAWTTLLTGLYPLHHGARENLYPGARIKKENSFAWSLQRMGYRTLYATDDRRFNNIDKGYGFSEIVGPGVGILDILLGSFNDFPLGNLLINSKAGKWLLPYNYINRAGYFSYYPATFDRALQTAIGKGRLDKPLFLAVHFTLPHWPHSWARSNTVRASFQSDINDSKQLYQEAVRLADQQAGNLLAYLKSKGILQNSMVVVLSDHGEALFQNNARQTRADQYVGGKNNHFITYLQKQTDTKLEQSGGHGSDLLSPEQFKCILGFQLYKNGNMISKPAAIDNPVSLTDIAPTIARYFKSGSRDPQDGASLSNTILYQQTPPANRYIMMESGILPNIKLNKNNIGKFAKFFYIINPRTLAIEMREERFACINAMKLYGVRYNEWILALYPDSHFYIPVLLNMKTGAWSDVPDSAFFKTSPFVAMLAQLRQFYRQDLASFPVVPEACPSLRTKTQDVSLQAIID